LAPFGMGMEWHQVGTKCVAVDTMGYSRVEGDRS